MRSKNYIVHPDDPDIPAKAFRSKTAAEDFAASLCCPSWIEEVEY